MERQKLVLQDDMIWFEKVREISKIELLLFLLPKRVRSPFLVNSQRADISVANETFEHWLQILENLYLVYRISSFSSSKIRAFKRKKISQNVKYFSEWTEIPKFYQVHLGNSDFENVDYKTRVIPFLKFTEELGKYYSEYS